MGAQPMGVSRYANGGDPEISRTEIRVRSVRGATKGWKTCVPSRGSLNLEIVPVAHHEAKNSVPLALVPAICARRKRAT
jgi:hypothetical protein